ncbi:hypothetical protein BH11PLA2_BH11PLA2_46830 [soil metagenome]
MADAGREDEDDGIIDRAGHFYGVEPLDDAEIDELCEQLNFGDARIMFEKFVASETALNRQRAGVGTMMTLLAAPDNRNGDPEVPLRKVACRCPPVPAVRGEVCLPVVVIRVDLVQSRLLTCRRSVWICISFSAQKKRGEPSRCLAHPALGIEASIPKFAAAKPHARAGGEKGLTLGPHVGLTEHVSGFVATLYRHRRSSVAQSSRKPLLENLLVRRDRGSPVQ